LNVSPQLSIDDIKRALVLLIERYTHIDTGLLKRTVDDERTSIFEGKLIQLQWRAKCRYFSAM